MVGFSLVGAIPCILLAAVTIREAYMFGGALAVVGMVGLGGTYLFVHAFLPPLARNHPDYVSVRDNTAATRDELRATLDFITNKISSTAFVWMYGGAVISLFVTVVLNARLKVPDFYPDEYTFQIVITVVAIGWLIACAVVYKYLRDRPGPPLPAGENVMLFSVRRVFKSLGKARKLSNLYTFLLGWFFYSDAWGTQAAVSVLWTKTQLGFTSVELLIMAAEVQLLALIGTFAWNRLQMHTKISTKTSLLIQSSFCALIPAWGILGLFPSLSIGYKQKIEFFVAAGIHGLFTGATQSSCRSLFAQLLPAGEEAQYFSLYQIADKGSSWIGPLAVAAIYNSGASRWFVFVFSLCQFSVAAIVFSRVNLETGISQGTPVGAQEMDLPELTIVQV
ncbi:Autophagy protein 22 [Entophlyctis luteolus]|nr:Autophagy protein 22 [Entophlyctis luteolus]